MKELVVGSRANGKVHFLSVFMYGDMPIYSALCGAKLATGDVNPFINQIKDGTATDVTCSRCASKYARLAPRYLIKS